jgi:hypothetical protein
MERHIREEAMSDEDRQWHLQYRQREAERAARGHAMEQGG